MGIQTRIKRNTQGSIVIWEIYGELDEQIGVKGVHMDLYIERDMYGCVYQYIDKEIQMHILRDICIWIGKGMNADIYIYPKRVIGERYMESETYVQRCMKISGSKERYGQGMERHKWARTTDMGLYPSRETWGQVICEYIEGQRNRCMDTEIVIWTCRNRNVEREMYVKKEKGYRCEQRQFNM